MILTDVIFNLLEFLKNRYLTRKTKGSTETMGARRGVGERRQKNKTDVSSSSFVVEYLGTRNRIAYEGIGGVFLGRKKPVLGGENTQDWTRVKKEGRVNREKGSFGKTPWEGHGEE